MFKELIPIEEAQRIIVSNLSQIKETEEIFVDNSLGRILAKDVYSEIDVPSFDRATMDGYAVRSNNLQGVWENRPAKLRRIGYIKTGEFPKIIVRDGEAAKIDTGAVIPKGADAIVPIEYIEEYDDYILVKRSVPKWANIQWTGADISKGQLVFSRGTIITPRHIATLISIGRKKIRVYRKAKVAIFSIGDELVDSIEKMDLGKIIDVNSHSLMALVKEFEFEPIFLGIARDDLSDILAKLKIGLEISDIVISTGSSSVGYTDMIRRAVEKLGGKILFHGVKSKPGKPVLFAKIGEKGYLGLPGHPTSAIVSFFLYALQAIYRVAGALGKILSMRTLKFKLGRRVYGVKGRTLVQTVSLHPEKDIANPIPAISGSTTTLSLADAYFLLPEEYEYLDEGEEIALSPLWKIIQLPGLTIVGEFSPMLLRMIREKNKNSLIRYIKMPSSGALRMLEKGYADVAIIKDEEGEFERKLVYVGKDNASIVYSKYEINGINIERVRTDQSAVFKLKSGIAEAIIIPEEIAKLYGLLWKKVVGIERLKIIKNVK